METPFFPIITLSVTVETSGWIWPNFKLILALMYFIITCKYEKDPIKNSREKVETSFFPLYPMGIFSDVPGQLTPQSVEIQTRPSSHACHHYLQVRKGSDEKQPRKSGDTVFSIITLWELSVAMETRVLIRSGTKPNAAFPPPP